MQKIYLVEQIKRNLFLKRDLLGIIDGHFKVFQKVFLKKIRMTYSGENDAKVALMNKLKVIKGENHDI